MTFFKNQSALLSTRLFTATLVVLISASTAFAGLSGDSFQRKSSAKYPTTAMGRNLIGEDRPEHPYPRGRGLTTGVRYLRTVEEREEFRFVIADGRVYDSKGGIAQLPKRKLNYLMDSAGNFYIFDNSIHEEIRHSSILAGAPVAGAGEIKVDAEGRILKINSNSGHYNPGPRFFENVKRELIAGGVNLSEVEVVEPPVDNQPRH